MKSTKWNMADVCIWISDMKAFIACSSSLTCYVVSAKVAAKAQAKAKAHAKAQAKALPHAPVQSASSIVDKFFAVTELPTENCLNFGKGGRVFFLVYFFALHMGGLYLLKFLTHTDTSIAGCHLCFDFAQTCS